jgi:hypothetical protein
LWSRRAQLLASLPQFSAVGVNSLGSSVGSDLSLFGFPLRVSLSSLKEACVRRIVLVRSSCVAAVAAVTISTLAHAGGVQLQPRAGQPLDGLTPAELELFVVGQQRYLTPLTPEAGLGPIFNKAGCFSCHSNPVGGWGSISVKRFGLEEKGVFNPLDELGGSLLQAQAISVDCREVIPEEANVEATRITNSSLAFGMIEAIPSEAIAANADPDDLNGDGISGKVHWVGLIEDPKAPLRAGRFGWKAQLATVLSFSADASRMEMGLTNRFIPTESAPNGNEILLGECDLVPDPEDGPDSEGYDFIDRVTHFQRYLAQPPQTPKSGMTGELVFNAIGCSQCHTASFSTANDLSIEAAIRGQTIRPYSDFLLHDMGTLADGIVQGDATEGEFRTPTLWNLRTRDPMLHDGSVAGGTFSDRATAAILAHGPFGEGAASAAAFAKLSSVEQDQLIAFLDSLGRIEFDLDGDNHVNINDLATMRACFGQSKVSADDTCAVADVDQNGVIDEVDAAGFATAWEGTNGDCNGNGISDIEEIVVGTLPDKDGDGIPDSCPGACPADLNGSGQVDSADLTVLLAAWGTTGADLNGSGSTDSADLTILLAGWGACP